MKTESSLRPSQSFRSKLKFSIIWKLNFKLFLRLLIIFFNLNLGLVLVSATGLFVYAEKTIGTTAEKITAFGEPQDTAQNWLDLSDISISTLNRLSSLTEEQEGFHLPHDLRPYFPSLTASGVRKINLPEGEGFNLWWKIQHLTYSVTVPIDNKVYLIAYHPQKACQIVLLMLGLVMLVEFLLLLGNISKSARLIRHTLLPIEQLAEATRSLSHENAFSPEVLRDLAGKLDNINATRLDTRISLSETQSELQSLAEAINSMLDRINASYRSQIRFVSDASHELRTPISVIQGYANLLDRWGKKDEKILQEGIDAIKNETANMKTLVEQLLFLARGDNNTMTLQMERFELSALAEEVLRETQMIDEGHEYASSLSPVYIHGDKALIKQATRILIDNAIKYTPAGREISLQVGRDGNFARLTVQDEGIGIVPEAVPHIFDRFFRTDESRARATGGSGLGLSIAKWITERHGGHLEVLSRVDVGTRISILLPVASEEIS